MRIFITLIVFSAIILSSCTSNKTLVEFNTKSFSIRIDTNGNIISLTDSKNNVNYLATDTISPLLSCRIDSQMFYPISTTSDNETSMAKIVDTHENN